MTVVNIVAEVFAMIVTTLLIVFACKNGIPRCKKDYFFLFMLVLNFIVLLADCLTWCLYGCSKYSMLLYLLNFFVFSIGYAITALFTYYMILHISEKRKISIWVAHIIGLLCLTAIILVVVSLFNHMYFSFENGVYERGSLYWISQVYPITILLVDMLIILKYKDVLKIWDTISLLSYIICPMIAMIIQLKVYGITFLYLSTTLSMLIIFFNIYIEQGKLLKETELEITQMKISIMLSQIQPHFLYNSLSSIAALCDINPKGAQNAIIMFSEYLRGNLDSIKRNTPVPFAKELEHVKLYLELEKMRFGDALNVEFDIETEDFLVPSLTVQPLVENAVKYGLGKKENGGTICFYVKDMSSETQIIIADDGVGFNTREIQEDGKMHIGIDNVRNRLSAQINATMEIKSGLNQGTTVIIHIPKETNK